MRKRALLSILALPLAVFAQEGNDDYNKRLTALEKKVNQPFYNAPARAEVRDSYNLFLTGDFLYWKANENGLTYGIQTNNPTGDLTDSKLHMLDPHFRWDYGFRAGIGLNIAHDHWDIYANWTHFYSGAHAHKEVSSDQGIYPVWEFPTDDTTFVTTAEAFWKLKLNILDVELGKEYYAGKKLALRPHLDLRNLWITQHYTADYGPKDDLDSVRMRNCSWGIGPRVGLDLQFWLYKGLSLSGTADASLVYGRFSIHSNETNSSGHVGSHQTLHMARAITDLGAFIGWDQMLFHDHFHIGIKGGWEQHLFFEQNQFYRFVDPTFEGSIVSNQGDLALQGWTVNARIDF